MSRTYHHPRGWKAKDETHYRRTVKAEKHRDLHRRSLTVEQLIDEHLGVEPEFSYAHFGLRDAHYLRAGYTWWVWDAEASKREECREDEWRQYVDAKGTYMSEQDIDDYDWLHLMDPEPEYESEGEDDMPDALGWMPRVDIHSLAQEIGWDGFTIREFERSKPVDTTAYDKWRVYEIARTVGVDSAYIIELLRGQGEYVKCASSTVPKHVAKQLIRDVFPSPASEDDRVLLTVAIADSQPAKPLPRPGRAMRPVNNPFVSA